jgi:sarcosine oxidase
MTKVLVLGVGGMGSSACYHLAKRGADVTGIEQFSLLHEKGSSHGETRIIRQAYFEHPDYVPLLRDSYLLWKQLEAESSQHLYHETGILYSLPQESKILAGLRSSAEQYKIPLEELNSAEFKARFRGFAQKQGNCALFEPNAGYLKVEESVLAHTDQAKKNGCEIVEKQRVLSWSANSSGVTLVTAEKTYQADKLVITAGAWSQKILCDLALPLKPLRKFMYWISGAHLYQESESTPCFFYETPEGIFYGFPAIGRGSDFRLKLAEHTGGHPLYDDLNAIQVPSAEEAKKIESFVLQSLPHLKELPDKVVPCIYTMTPDEHFIVDRHPEYSNVIVAVGFSGHGFKFSSVIGKILSDLALDEVTSHPIDFLKVRNFTF